ncbi:hypothetical protein [Pantoea stewartii]|uniref:hypothetical protein n=1 Tax=Pantoea stewartii TaxID=66269 RepID=UPI0016237CEE|nr:hypothetical protein [Pantoea stewartii]MBC0853177.1 hypothetical protein [Pantoea stewartii]
MSRKTHKKYQASVQQTFCVNGGIKGVLKGVAKYFLGLFIRETISEIFHSESFASIWTALKELIQWEP